MNRLATTPKLLAFFFLIAVLASSAALAAPYTTPSAGQEGGGPFEVYCPADKVLAGIKGKHGIYLDRVDLLCVPVSCGTWVGDPAEVSGYGGTGGAPSRSVVRAIRR